ncbi:MAG TPA: ribosome biogenesis GTPase Der, partial [Gammaproteobacteria bacterium]|nr:ribosome biogenesis GTPase Der [Gammaproteobacteria bacterium]
MLPSIALVGRPNVGKSTLFNKLTRSRDALVADVPGLTRDRRYGRMEFDGGAATLIDTGGLFGDDVLADALTQQTRLAVNEADIVLLMFDGRDGVTAADEDVVEYLRKSNVAFIPVINKIDGLPEHEITAEFGRFGFDRFLQISASHSRGLKHLREHLLAVIQNMDYSVDADDDLDANGIRVAV